MPVFLILISIIFWQILKLIKKVKQAVLNETISTMIVLLFMIHPNIVQINFQNFRCLDTDGTERVLEDLEVICFSNVHKFYSFSVAIPSIIIWGIGIPLFAMLLLFRDRNNL